MASAGWHKLHGSAHEKPREPTAPLMNADERTAKRSGLAERACDRQKQARTARQRTQWMDWRISNGLLVRLRLTNHRPRSSPRPPLRGRGQGATCGQCQDQDRGVSDQEGRFSGIPL